MQKACGLNILLELITLAHLHTSRAVIPTQTQAIEGVGIEKGNEKEWYYGTEAKDRNGPVGFSELKDLFAEGNITAKTKVWAQGMEGWRLLHRVITPITVIIISNIIISQFTVHSPGQTQEYIFTS